MQDHHSPAGRHSEPILNAPAVVVALVAVFLAVYVLGELLSEERAEWLLYSLALVPARYTATETSLPGATWASVTSFITHMAVHGNFAHLAINSAWLLAVGTPVARRMSVPMFLVFFTACGIAGALTFLLLNWGLDAPMVGASGAISGLMAAVFRLLYGANGASGFLLLREHPERAPRLSLRGVKDSRPAMTAIAVWVIVNFVFAFGLGDLSGAGGVAWEAHLGGFFAGLLGFGLVDRGPRTDAPA